MSLNKFDTVSRLVLKSLLEHRALSRCFLEEVVEEAGFSPSTFTKVVRTLRNENAIKRYAIESPINGTATDVYSAHSLSVADLERCKQRITERHRFLNPQKMRVAGEQYVRALFRYARDHGNLTLLRVPNKKMLGAFTISKDYRADILVTARLERPVQLLVECKNHRERFELNNRLFPKLLIAAHTNHMQPVLVAAHLSKRAEKFCQNIGIAVLHLRKQIISRKDHFTARALWTKRRADRIFHPVRLNRPFADPNRMAEITAEHIAVVCDQDWLMHAAKTWSSRSAGEICELIALLQSGRYMAALKLTAPADSKHKARSQSKIVKYPASIHQRLGAAV